MKYILLALSILFSSFIFSQARTGIYTSNGYLVYKYDFVIGDYLLSDLKQDKILILLNKETIEFTGLMKNEMKIVFSNISPDDEHFVYYTPEFQIYIQREIKYMLILSNKKNGKYQTMISLKNMSYLGKLEFYEFENIHSSD